MRRFGGRLSLLGVLFVLACSKPAEMPDDGPGPADLRQGDGPPQDQADLRLHDLRPDVDLAPPPLGTDVLIYYGSGGVPPNAGLIGCAGCFASSAP